MPKLMDEKYNDGKDLMPEDIIYCGIKSEGKNKGFRAYLGFARMPFKNGLSIKCYTAFGETKQEARNELITIMVDHLNRLRTEEEEK